jgi:N-acetylneuraminic acid mutarotase
MSNARSQHTATLLPDGRVLVVGGFGAENSATLYDPAKDQWTPAAPMNTARVRHTATVLQNGKVLVIGGSNSGTGQGGAAYLNSAELYDPSTNSWTQAGQMATARSGHTATLLPGGQVFVIGGNDGTRMLSSAEGYDPSANRWVQAAPMSVARWLHTSTLVPGGQIVVAGGADGSTPLSSVERYDLATNTWFSSKS